MMFQDKEHKRPPRSTSAPSPPEEAAATASVDAGTGFLRMDRSPASELVEWAAGLRLSPAQSRPRLISAPLLRTSAFATLANIIPLTHSHRACELTLFHVTSAHGTCKVQDLIPCLVCSCRNQGISLQAGTFL